MSDLFTPPYLAREVAAALFEVELEIWSASGHFPFLEDAARFNRKLEMYVRRQSGGPLLSDGRVPDRLTNGEL